MRRDRIVGQLPPVTAALEGVLWSTNFGPNTTGGFNAGELTAIGLPAPPPAAPPPPPPSTQPIAQSGVNLSDFGEFTFQQDVPAGSFLLVCVGDGFGSGAFVTGISLGGTLIPAFSDTKGNTYGNGGAETRDVGLIGLTPDGGGSVFVGHSVTTHDLVAGVDSLRVAFSGGPWSFFVLATILTTDATVVENNATGINPHGRYGPGSITVAAEGTDLLVGFAVYQLGVTTDDSVNGWTEVYSGGDAQNHMLVAVKHLTSDTTVPYTTSSSGVDVGDGAYGAAVAVPYH